MTKQEAREYIESYLENLINELQIELEDKVKASVMQCSDVNDMDSHSQQFQTVKDEQKVKDRLNRFIKKQKFFQNISTVPTDIVQEGSLIEIKDFYIYVGVVTLAISTKEKTIVGISTAAPMYKELANQKVGFKFKFNGIDCWIESIQ